MLIKPVNKDDYKPTISDRRKKTIELLQKMYNSENDCFSLEDTEKEYTSIASLCAYLRDEGMRFTREVLLEKGFSTKQWYSLKYNLGNKLNIFKIRKLKAQAVILVTISRPTDAVLDEYRNILGEE